MPPDPSCAPRPISVAPLLREHLWGRLHAAVLTSATLSIDGDLSHTRARLGLAGAERARAGLAVRRRRSRRGSTCPRDAPDPRAAGWDQAIADHIVAIVRASDGRALCLFTSWRALEAVRGLVAAEARRLHAARAGRGAARAPARGLPRRRPLRPARDAELLAGRRHPRRGLLLRDHRPPAVRRARAIRSSPAAASRSCATAARPSTTTRCRRPR